MKTTESGVGIVAKMIHVNLNLVVSIGAEGPEEAVDLARSFVAHSTIKEAIVEAGLTFVGSSPKAVAGVGGQGGSDMVAEACDEHSEEFGSR